ncbi:S8 family peptidase [Bacillus timonensis]|nr:S8 family peptidase [Bacillus timonensis]
MFGFSMVQLVRSHAHKLDRPLREKVLNTYKPFKWTPCIFHNAFEGLFKKFRKIPVIIEFENDCYHVGIEEVQRVVKKYARNHLRKEFTTISSCCVDMTPQSLEEVLSSCSHIRKVYLNREVKAFLNVAVPSANARNIVRKKTTLTGKGVTIAVVDTGIHPHKDLADRIIDFKDFVKGRTEPYDDNGHGTHCAGDAASNGESSGGKYAGPAPKANLIGVKVLNKMGSGSLDQVIDGVEWCIKYNADNPENKIDIISMSLGSTAQQSESEQDDPVVKVVEKAWDEGIVVCVAAGNEGPEVKTIASPGISEKVITVGALDDRNVADSRASHEIASFSSRGPTIFGKEKPDIVAPGVNIISLRSPGSYLDKMQGSNRVENDYFQLSGTSMATPICAGVVALVLEANPSLSPDEVKRRLIDGADIWRKRDPNIYGKGYINADRSI